MAFAALGDASARGSSRHDQSGEPCANAAKASRPTRWSLTWSRPTSTRVPPHTGRGGWTWYTGSAGWMYRLIVESLARRDARGRPSCASRRACRPIGLFRSITVTARPRTTSPSGRRSRAPGKGSLPTSVTVDGVAQTDRLGAPLVDDRPAGTRSWSRRTRPGQVSGTCLAYVRQRTDPALAHSPSLGTHVFLIFERGFMNIDNRWVAAASPLLWAPRPARRSHRSTRRRFHRTARDVDHATQLKSWENEGGNAAPSPVVAARM